MCLRKRFINPMFKNITINKENGTEDLSSFLYVFSVYSFKICKRRGEIHDMEEK